MCNIALLESEDHDYIDESEFFNLCDEQEKEVLLECIRSLETIYSDVLVYYYLHEYSVKEIAKILDIKEDAVRKRISRGRVMLAELLKRRGFHE